jgi:hypothetical protein
MSPTSSSIYNLLALASPAPPPYNKVAKERLSMTVEVETVQLRKKDGGQAVNKEKKFPYYPVLQRTVEWVGNEEQDGDNGGCLSPGSGSWTSGWLSSSLSGSKSSASSTSVSSVSSSSGSSDSSDSVGPQTQSRGGSS